MKQVIASLVAVAGMSESATGGMDSMDLLQELARAMHDAAEAQFSRITAELERQRLRQMEAIVARTSTETDDLKADLDADTRAIDAWAKAEAEKIKLERMRRIDARRDQHASKVQREATIKEREVLAVEAAIDQHLGDLRNFFGELESTTDPARIASVAAMLPALPALDDIALDARHAATSEFALRDRVGDISLESPSDVELLPEAATEDEPPLKAVMESPGPATETHDLGRTWGSVDSRPWGAEIARPWEPAALAEVDLVAAALPDMDGSVEPLLPLNGPEPWQVGEPIHAGGPNVEAPLPARAWPNQPQWPSAPMDAPAAMDAKGPAEAAPVAGNGNDEAPPVSSEPGPGTVQPSAAPLAESASHGSTLLRAIAAFRPMASNSNHGADSTDKER